MRWNWLFFNSLVAIGCFGITNGKKNKYLLTPLQAEEKWIFTDNSDIECGATKSFEQFKEPSIGEKQDFKFPFTGYLVKKIGSVYVPVCMVTLLPELDNESTSIVLTISNCIKDKKEIDQYYVYTGQTFPVQDELEIYAIESITLDKNSPSALVDNPMVLTLDRDVTLDALHETVCLPKPLDTIPKDAKCVVASLLPGKELHYKYVVHGAEQATNTQCKSTHTLSGMDSRMDMCAYDQRQGAMLHKGGPIVCKVNGRWVQYGIETRARHVMESLNSDYVIEDIASKKSPAIFIDVAKFRKLMQDSQSLQKFSRINLMQLR